MKILILVESLEVNRTSSGIVSSNFINTIADGNELTCLHQEDCRHSFPWLPNVELKVIDLSTPGVLSNLLMKLPKIRALPTYMTGFSLAFNRMVADWKNAISKELAIDNYDVVIALGTGSSFAPHYAISELNIKVKWIANMHDPYPMNHYPEPYQKKDNVFYNKQVKRIKKVFLNATWITFPSQRLLEWMSNYHPEITNKSFVLPHAEVFKEGLPGSPEDNKVTLDVSKFNLLHAGSLLGPRDPKYLIKAFMRFIEEDRERKKLCVLNIVGKIAREHTGFETEYEIVKSNVKIITTRVSYKHSLKLLKHADVLIILEAAATESPFMPGKLSDYISTEKPILALTPKLSETSRLLGEGYPYITETDNEEEIYGILVKLWKEWKSDNLFPMDRNDLKGYISSGNINATLLNHINVQ